MNTQIAAIKDEISKSNNLAGTLFQMIILFGIKKARR
jgi:hypothetical protein